MAHCHEVQARRGPGGAGGVRDHVQYFLEIEVHNSVLLDLPGRPRDLPDAAHGQDCLRPLPVQYPRLENLHPRTLHSSPDTRSELSPHLLHSGSLHQHRIGLLDVDKAY